MAYLHGAYSEIVASTEVSAQQTKAAPLYVGTAPVHTLPNGKTNLNKPVTVTSFNEAVALFGYSEDWAKYTLCEAMYAHFVLGGIAPLVLVNVLDVDDNKSASAVTANKTPAGGRIVLEDAESIILDTISIPDKELGTDFTTAYDYTRKRITIAEKTTGALGSVSLAVSYYTVDATGVDAATVIGAADGEGNNTGLYCIRDVYTLCGIIPDVLLAPGFSDAKTVHDAMATLSVQVSGHWNTLFYTDLPLTDGEATLTLTTAAAWKATNGYTADNEKTHYPMWAGADSHYYHLSVLAAVNRQRLVHENDNIPYKTPSNTEILLAGAPFYGAEVTATPNDELINAKLNANGITSAVFLGGRWVIWGAHTASYTQETATAQNLSETNLAMLHYIANDFQVRRAADVDNPLTRNTMQQIIAEEKARLDALISIGALLYGEVTLIGTPEAVADMMQGDYGFAFTVTTTPISKSLKALLSYTEAGLVTYFEEVA
jgi:hypothetical protein